MGQQSLEANSVPNKEEYLADAFDQFDNNDLILRSLLLLSFSSSFFHI